MDIQYNPLDFDWLSTVRRSSVALLLIAVVLVWPWYQLRESLFGQATQQNTWPVEGYSMSCARYLIALEKLRVYASQLQIESRDTFQQKQSSQDLKQWLSTLTAQNDTINRLADQGNLISRSPESSISVGRLSEVTSSINQALSHLPITHENHVSFDASAEIASQIANTLIDDLYAKDSHYYFESISSKNASIKRIYDTGSAIILMAFGALTLTVHALRLRRKALALQAKSMAEVKCTAQARSVLLGMVSHELRTPLQTLDATLELIRVNDVSNTHESAIARAQASVALMSSELQTLAQYARLTTDDAPQHLEPVPLYEFLARVIRPYEERAAQSSQIFVLPSISHQLSITVDRTRLHQILDNFVSNAVKYGGPGEILISFSMKPLDANHQAVDIKFQVIDSGPGIPPSDLSKVWDPYFRVSSTSNKVYGTGLGLSVVRLLAETVRWDVGYSRTNDDRTSFYVSFRTNA